MSKIVSLCFAVAVAVVFAANVTSANEAGVPVTAPVDAVVVDSACGCKAHAAVALKPVRLHKAHIRHFAPAPCAVAVPAPCEEVAPLVPICAYKKVFCSYRPTTVWVESELAAESESAVIDDPCAPVTFEPFEAFKKTLFGFHPITAWKKVPVVQ